MGTALLVSAAAAAAASDDYEYDDREHTAASNCEYLHKLAVHLVDCGVDVVGGPICRDILANRGRRCGHRSGRFIVGTASIVIIFARGGWRGGGGGRCSHFRGAHPVLGSVGRSRLKGLLRKGQGGGGNNTTKEQERAMENTW